MWLIWVSWLCYYQIYHCLYGSSECSHCSRSPCLRHRNGKPFWSQCSRPPTTTFKSGCLVFASTPIDKIPSAISCGVAEFCKTLFVPQWRKRYSTDGGKLISFIRHRISSVLSPPMPRLIAPSGSKYFCQISWYRPNPFTMDAPQRAIFPFE